MIVFDTSPLQAVHRAGLLDLLHQAFPRVLVPGAVYDETQASLSLTKAGHVPNIDDFPWIEVVRVADAEIVAADAQPLANRRRTEQYLWLNRKIERPEIEAVLLAKRLSARAVIEDAQGVRCAMDLKVVSLSVADVLIELERDGHIADASPYATRILETRYYSKELRWLSWRRTPGGQV